MVSRVVRPIHSSSFRFLVARNEQRSLPIMVSFNLSNNHREIDKDINFVGFSLSLRTRNSFVYYLVFSEADHEKGRMARNRIRSTGERIFFKIRCESELTELQGKKVNRPHTRFVILIFIDATWAGKFTITKRYLQQGWSRDSQTRE